MATVIDAFLITLGLKADGVQEGAHITKTELKSVQKEAEKTANELQEKGRQAGEFFHSLTEAAVEFFGVALSVGGAMEFIHHTMEAEISAGRLAKTMKVDVEEIEAMGEAVKRFGGSAEGMQQTLMSLNDKLVAIQNHLPRAKMALKAFQVVLGGNAESQIQGKNAIQVAAMLAEKISKMDEGKAMGLRHRLGVDESVIRMWHTGGEELEKLTEHMKDLGVASAEEVESSEKLHLTMLDMQQSFGSVGRQIMEAVKPALKWFADKLSELAVWARAHPQTIKTALIGIAAGLAVLGVAAAITAGAFMGITVPILILSAKVAAIAALVGYLALEWKKWHDGGKSALGGLFETFSKIWNAIKYVVLDTFAVWWAEVKNWAVVIKDALEFVYDLFFGTDAELTEDWKKLCDALEKFFKVALNFMLYAFFVFVLSIGKAWDGMWDHMKEHPLEFIKWLAGVFGKIAFPEIYLPYKALKATGIGGGIAHAAHWLNSPLYDYQHGPSVHTEVVVHQISVITPDPERAGENIAETLHHHTELMSSHANQQDFGQKK